jgi:hypothetical protein
MEEQRTFENQGQFSLCQWVQQRLPDMHEGYLDAMTAEAVRAHLTVCYICAREYDEMLMTIKLVETLPFVEPVKDHAPAIMAAILRQPGHSFQAPVVEMETKISLKSAVSALAKVFRLPRTTTGQQRQADPRDRMRWH